jgi:hypothetical protein
VLVLAVAGVLMWPGEADAGEFQIGTCGADGGYSTAAFQDFVTRGMKVKRACNPEGPGLRGLVTYNVARGGKVKRGARSIVTLSAPPGTQFVRLGWSGEVRRRDCRYALQLYAEGPEVGAIPIKNVRANRGCPERFRGQVAGWPRMRSYRIEGATRIVQRIVCVGSSSHEACSARGLNYIRTLKAAVSVADVSAPAVSVLQETALAAGAWVSGDQPVHYTAADNVGVRNATAVVGGVPGPLQVRPCDYSRPTPCSSGPGEVTFNTRRAPEGTQSLAVQASDAAGNIGSSAPILAQVDNTPPPRVDVSVEGGEAWRAQNGFAVLWQNPLEVDRAPIVDEHWRLCKAGTQECVTGHSPGEGIGRIDGLQAPDPGEWTFALWREDAAGNAEQDNASVPVTLRYDPEPPRPAFEPQAPTDPTRLSVLVDDKVSGLAGGQIEISRQGSETWQPLATVREGPRLVARVDDAQLPAGVYLLRARAFDQAGNEASTDRLLDGQPVVLTLPLRTVTTIKAGVERKRIIRKSARRAGNRRHFRRRVTTLMPRARAGLGDTVVVAGRLTDQAGRSLAGAVIGVSSATRAAPTVALGVVRTDAKGRFRTSIRATASMSLALTYAGTAQLLPAQRELSLVVPGHSTLRVTRKRALNGQSVTFTGRLRGLSPQAAGKLVELQVRVNGRWQTFRTTGADATGSWRVRYRFRSTRGLQRYRFRARLPAEGLWPYATGASRSITVQVRGPA